MYHIFFILVHPFEHPWLLPSFGYVHSAAINMGAQISLLYVDLPGQTNWTDSSQKKKYGS